MVGVRGKEEATKSVEMVSAKALEINQSGVRERVIMEESEEEGEEGRGEGGRLTVLRRR